MAAPVVAHPHPQRPTVIKVDYLYAHGTYSGKKNLTAYVIHIPTGRQFQPAHARRDKDHWGFLFTGLNRPGPYCLFVCEEGASGKCADPVRFVRAAGPSPTRGKRPKQPALPVSSIEIGWPQDNEITSTNPWPYGMATQIDPNVNQHTFDGVNATSVGDFGGFFFMEFRNVPTGPNKSLTVRDSGGASATSNNICVEDQQNPCSANGALKSKKPGRKRQAT